MIELMVLCIFFYLFGGLILSALAIAIPVTLGALALLPWGKVLIGTALYFWILSLNSNTPA